MTVDKQVLSRRSILKVAAVALAAGTVGAHTAPRAQAQNRALGTVLDYAVGVPSAQSIKAAGHLGAIRYVSRPRPGTESWMTGKPVKESETRDLATHGLFTASVYQYGKSDTADWRQGATGAAVHAPQAIALHRAAGGPTGVPIYVAIDDNPTRAQYTGQIKPYLRAFETALTAAGYSLGIYGNYSTIDWAITDGLGDYFWQHEWGSNGRIHPKIHLHQVRIDKDTVGGVRVDINNVYRSDWGQWQPGKAAAPTTPATPSKPAEQIEDQPASTVQASSIPDINLNGSSVSGEQLQQGVNIATQVAQYLR